MKKPWILFDLDGTLTDSGEGIMSCARLALAHFGISPENDTALRTFIGPPLRDSFARFGVSAEHIEEAVALYRGRYNTVGKYENAPYPGVQELLDRLRADGRRMYVATTKPEELAVDILHHFGLDQYFTRICGAAVDASLDSKAKVIAHLLTREGYSEGTPVHAVMVGDTAFDVLGAAAHGIPTVGVAWGYGTVASLRDAGAQTIAHSMDELYALLAAH